MTTVHLAILLRPLFTFVFMVAIVLPIEWLLFHIFPNCRLKVWLFKPRTGARATERDVWVFRATAVVMNVLLWIFIFFLISRGEQPVG